jgi:hypothetical protein
LVTCGAENQASSFGLIAANQHDRLGDYVRFCRRRRPRAERPTPSNAKDANGDGFGTGTTGVSEKLFCSSAKVASVTENASVTVRLVVAAKVVLALDTEIEAERLLPFESVSVLSPDAPSASAVAKKAREASVIGSLEGAVIVYEMEPFTVVVLRLGMNTSPGSFVTGCGLTEMSDAG